MTPTPRLVRLPKGLERRSDPELSIHEKGGNHLEGNHGNLGNLEKGGKGNLEKFIVPVSKMNCTCVQNYLYLWKKLTVPVVKIHCTCGKKFIVPVSKIHCTCGKNSLYLW